MTSYSHLEHANDFEPSQGHHHLLEHCPVHLEATYDPPFYVVSRQADVLDVLLQPDLWNNGDGPGVYFQDGGVLGSADGDDHRRQRKVLQDGFRPRMIDNLAPRVEVIGDQLWNTVFSADGEGDFVHLFAFPFPAIVIAELLGVAQHDRDQFGKWSTDIVNGLGGGDLGLVEAANAGIYSIVDALVAQRVARIDKGEELSEDVLSVLTKAYVEGTLQYGEVRRLSQQLLVAGHETTASLLSLMLYRLIENPELVETLRADMTLVPAAVEEFLRYDSPVQGLFRTNAVECAIDGFVIPPRTKLQALFAAANRDPAYWEAPDEIRFDRPSGRPHVAFGWGIHHCIGAPLARREGQMTLRWILERFESFEVIGPVTTNETFILRGLTSLPIRWKVRA